MKKVFYISVLIFPLLGGAAEKLPGKWSSSGVLDYSYAYARNYLGYQMRKAKWRCKTCFTAGAKQEQEHSVWYKGNRKMQLMIWRIDSGKTGFAKGEITAGKKGNVEQ